MYKAAIKTSNIRKMRRLLVVEKWPFCKSYYNALWNCLKREDFKMKGRLSISNFI